jgi:hypothetical protein
MMKKQFAVLMSCVLMMTFIGLSGCGKSIQAGAPGLNDMLASIPEDATGIFTLNFKKISSMDIFKEQLEKAEADTGSQDAEFFKDYQEFIEKTGVDPEKDIHSIVVTLFKSFSMKADSNKNMAALINLNYDKARVLAFIKEKAGEYNEELSGDLAIYSFKTPKGETMSLCFLDKDMMVFGEKIYVKNIVDLRQKGGKSILDNAKLKPYIDEIKSSRAIHFVFDLPQELKESQPQGAPFKVDLSKAETLTGFIDHANMAWSGEIRLISPDEESNKQIVNLLNGLKGMAALAGPEVSELVSQINLTSSGDDVKLTFSLTDELLKKLQAKAKEKASGFGQPSSFD